MTFGVSFESVLTAARMGADWAWAALYREIAGAVMGYMRARGAADPEEAAGDVFFELARVLPTFEGDENAFNTLVFALAYKRLLVDDAHPRRRSHSALADRALDHLRADIHASGELDLAGVPEEIRRALASLTPIQRDILSLRIVGGLTIEQTAQVLEQRVSAVRSSQRKALGKVRSHLPKGLVVT